MNIEMWKKGKTGTTIKIINTLISGLLVVMVIGILDSCAVFKKDRRPNVILIMADDMGYECLSSNGSLSYQTPVLDALATDGIHFTNCYSQPLCTPSRVKIMTGKYNYRNYEKFGYLNPDELTVGNIMKDAGYETCIAGKWQLNGTSGNSPADGWEDTSRPYHFGFNEYCLWQLDKRQSRYSDPLIIKNGEYLTGLDNKYGPDIFCDFIKDFIKRKKDQPFFIYYPMVLVHDPFVPTPDSDEWDNKELRKKGDPRYFTNMMSYTDKLVGEIISQLDSLNVRDNTILIFTADNGTSRRIVSRTEDGDIPGGKGLTLDTGNHVPFIISWPKRIKQGRVEECLIEFSDFFPTLAEIAETDAPLNDGQSFYPLLKGEKYNRREWVFVHYDPMWSDFLNKQRNRYTRSENLKLYQDGRIYSLVEDPFEKDTLTLDDLSKNDILIMKNLQEVLDQSPEWK